MSQESRLGGGWDGWLDKLASIAVIVAAGALVWVAVIRQPAPQGGPVSVERLDPDIVVNYPQGAAVRGHSDARVVLMEFSDFECPFCRQYALEVYPRLMEELVGPGMVQYMFRHYPMEGIHENASRAAEAVECAAGEGKFWTMHDRLFEAAGALTNADILAYAASMGLQPSSFEACLDSGAMRERVLEDRREGIRLGVEGTPTFFLAEKQENGMLRLLTKVVGAQPYETLESLLREELSRVSSVDGISG